MSSVSPIGAPQGPLPPQQIGQGSNSLRNLGLVSGAAGVAQFLGVSMSQLRQDRANGMNLADIAQSSGKSVTDVANAFISGVQNGLNTAVSQGRITQTQADNLLQFETNRMNHVLQNQGLSPISNPASNSTATSSGQIVNASA